MAIDSTVPNIDNQISDDLTALAGNSAGLDLLTKGWINPGVLPTRVNGTSFTLPGDWRDRKQVGDREYVLDTTAKYAYIWGVSYAGNTTTFTTSPWADTTGAAVTFSASPTAYYYSKSPLAIGFPAYHPLPAITYTTSGDAFTNPPATNTAKFWMIGNKFHINIEYTYNASSGGTLITYLTFASNPPAPINASAILTASKGNLAVVARYVTASNHIRVTLYDGNTAISNNGVVSMFGGWLIAA